MNDRVHGFGFAYECRIGFHAYERHIRQRVVVDFEAETDWRPSARLDEPSAAIIDYFQVNRLIGELVRDKEWRLLEAMAEDVARLLCRRFPVFRVRVRVTKTPFDMPNASGVAAECWRIPQDFADEDGGAEDGAE